MVPHPSNDELQALNDQIHHQDTTALNTEELGQVRQLHDGDARYLGNELRELLEWLSSQPWYPRSMVFVTANHGERLGEQNRLSHPWGAEPYDELVTVAVRQISR